MLHAIIVEDEPHIAQLIQHLIDWDALNICLLGVYEDGLSALQAIYENRPQIVITDIRIPGIDGIELIGRVKERNFTCDFIIISGYRQFEYAQQAVSYGVQEYLLKPIQRKELQAALEKIIRKQEQTAYYDEKLSQNIKALHDSFLAEFCARGYDGRSLEDLAPYELNFQPGFFQCIYLDVDAAANFIPASLPREIVLLVLRQLSPHCYEVIPYEKNSRQTLFMMNYSNRVNLDHAYTHIFDAVRAELLQKYTQTMTVTMGVGTASDSLADQDLLRTAEYAIRYRLQNGGNKLYFFQQLQFDTLSAADAVPPTVQKELVKWTELLDHESMRQQLEGIFSVLGTNTSPAVIQEVFDTVSALIAGTIESSTAELTKDALLKQIFPAEKDLGDYTLRSLCTLLEGWCGRIFADAAHQRELRGSRPIYEAKLYIDQHYNTSVTLEAVAEHIHLIPSYLSALFKKETGLTFSDYLTLRRIQEAKQLLRSSDLSVAEVGAAVGYRDNRYFSRIFTKVTGIKPSSYRKYS